MNHTASLMSSITARALSLMAVSAGTASGSAECACCLTTSLRIAIRERLAPTPSCRSAAICERTRSTAMARLSRRRVERLIFPVSFYRQKAKHVKATCERHLSEYGGRVPATMEELLL